MVEIRKIELGEYKVYKDLFPWGLIYRERYKGSGPHGYKTPCGIQWCLDIEVRQWTKPFLEKNPGYYEFATFKEAKNAAIKLLTTD